jgi:hypothetical protein
VSTYVPVPVPERYLPDVYRLLAELHAQDDVSLDAGKEWDPDFWRQPANIREHLLSRPQTIRDLAGYLSTHPDEEVGAEQAAQALQLPKGWNSLAGALGAFGNYCGNRGLEFPWKTRYASDGRARFTLDAKTADVFTAYL